jgi:hypothetical protein
MKRARLVRLGSLEKARPGAAGDFKIWIDDPRNPRPKPEGWDAAEGRRVVFRIYRPGDEEGGEP